jgi:hypothetical protein
MATCSWTRVLVVAAGLGMLVAWLSGSDALGWIAAVIGAAGAMAFERWSATHGGAACAVPNATRRREEP